MEFDQQQNQQKHTWNDANKYQRIHFSLNFAIIQGFGMLILQVSDQ
jgi:hypothetical protein